MIKLNQIPPAALEAGREAFLECDVNPSYSFDDVLSAAFFAIVEAWPGMKCEYLSTWVMEGADLPHVEETPALILPLTEQNDDKA